MLEIYRKEINNIDEQLIRLLTRRFELSSEIGIYKKENNMPISAPSREAHIISKIPQKNKSVHDSIATVYQTIFEVSRMMQNDYK